MLTRIWTGSVLGLVMLGVLVVDQFLAPWYPILLAVIVGLGVLACRELRGLLPPEQRPGLFLSHLGLQAVLLANWAPPGVVSAVFVALVMLAFVVEMRRFNAPGGAVVRIALTVWLFAYLGLLPGFLIQLRWFTHPAGSWVGGLALALAIFVPKFGDIGAYFAGRWLGRHPMTPVLSPKKTWEGALGGLLGSVGMALALGQLAPIVPGGYLGLVGFGLTVGLAGMIGDLAESLIKREGHSKDASATVPGFGGVLDVVDSVIFAAPVAALWLTWPAWSARVLPMGFINGG